MSACSLAQIVAFLSLLGTAVVLVAGSGLRCSGDHCFVVQDATANDREPSDPSACQFGDDSTAYSAERAKHEFPVGLKLDDFFPRDPRALALHFPVPPGTPQSTYYVHENRAKQKGDDLRALFAPTSAPRQLRGRKDRFTRLETVLESKLGFKRVHREAAATNLLTWVRLSLSDTEFADYPDSKLRRMDAQHKVNRFPGAPHNLNRKDVFALHFRRMRQLHGAQEFNFHPETYVLPQDWPRLRQAAQSEPQGKWIAKPAFGGQGAGIRLYNSSRLVAAVRRSGEYVVQRYIADPFLINGYKSTIRIYVLITSLHPLRIYLNRDGIVKFATSRFKTDISVHNSDYLNMHITNQAVNALLPSYGVSDNRTETRSGFRWSILHAWRKYMAESGHDPEPVWQRIKDVVVKAVIAAEPALLARWRQLSLPPRACFQLLGTDIDLASNLQPWLIESNANPTLHSEVSFERKHKIEMLTALFNMVGLNKFDTAALHDQLGLRIQSFIAEHASQIETYSPLRNLSAEALASLVDLEFEEYFAGSFERIYPLPAPDRYERFFEERRPLNDVARDWLRLRGAHSDPTRS